jgi:hypothetical protein
VTAREPGFYADVPEVEYHADPTSFSHSGAKLILRSPATYRWERDNPTPPTKAMQIGTAFHTRVLGVGQGWAVVPATSRAKADQEAHKAAKIEAEAAGLIPVDAKEDARLDAMVDAVHAHRLVSRMLEQAPGREVSAYCPDPATSVVRRCRYDALGERLAVDVKSCDSAEPEALAGRWGVIRKRGYDTQAAWYTDVAADLGRPLDAFAFVFVETTEPFNVTVAVLDAHDLAVARANNQRALERYRDCTVTGFWPSYVRDDMAAVVSLTQPTYTEERVA